MKEKIDIVIPVYSRNPTTEECLKSIKNNTSNFDYNLIIVEKLQSVAQNLNEGIKQVTSNWFVMMDDDVIVSPNWLDVLASYRKSDIGQIQPKMLYPFQKRIWSADVSLKPLAQKGHLSIEEDGEYSYVNYAEMLTGGIGLYNSEILKKGVIQDENFKGSQYNDVDFSLQIKKAGFKLLYCGKCEVTHMHLFRQANHSNRNYLVQKWPEIFS